jgi:hypothetical protein
VLGWYLKSEFRLAGESNIVEGFLFQQTLNLLHLRSIQLLKESTGFANPFFRCLVR